MHCHLLNESLVYDYCLCLGTWLLFLPCAWSLTLATPVGQLPDAGLLTLFALGSFMMRSSGCTINDMWDKDFDVHVCQPDADFSNIVIPSVRRSNVCSYTLWYIKKVAVNFCQ